MKDVNFMAKIQKGKCWDWLGAKDKYGYGRVVRKEFSKTPIKAHRYAFFLYHGRWPDGSCYHACGNKSCVRPSHLLDKVLLAVKPGSDNGVYFEKYMAEIQKRYVKGSRVNGMSELARQYDFSLKVIRQILKENA